MEFSLKVRHKFSNFPGEVILKEMIEGQRILIVGSGTSVKDLTPIPKDMKVFACNYSFQPLLENDLGRKDLDLYITTKHNIKKSFGRLQSLKKIKTDVFLFDSPFFLKKQTWLADFYKRYAFHEWVDNYYMEKLMAPEKIKDVRGRDCPYLSSGLKLLQYALYFKAKEIYLIGIDLGIERFYSASQELDGFDKNGSGHLTIDRAFLKIAAQKFRHIYSVSPQSPITQWVPHRKLS